ncbi:hypothetical protein D3C75_1278590 [compost metagenome]
MVKTRHLSDVTRAGDFAVHHRATAFKRRSEGQNAIADGAAKCRPAENHAGRFVAVGDSFIPFDVRSLRD